ncbi:uncharacterized protein N7515_004793 [Penicillium bovifimosum]|uniref:Uncharacterized protein n=1 Tax=Penicillium bovifimosum TaxID=126998 RepID=A0A9W9H129_9EURO|nr:uncharacterized protein N7515_004793 [Penicillium bovifimosum]KAJ5135515.1 hypothetical protein N7515_004793 [Penicillium bovifimosum]
MHTIRPPLFVLAFVLAVTQLATSQPIRTSRWVKIAQFPDPNASGTWKVFEKEGFDLLPDPPHVRYYQNPIWQKSQSNEPTEQEPPSNRYVKGVSESGKPTVSILVPERTTGQMHQSLQHTEEHGHSTSEDKEKSINAIHALDIQRQKHYSEVLQYLHMKHDLNTKYKDLVSASSLSSSSSGQSSSSSAFGFSLPSMRSKNVVSPMVMILLVVVWIAIFTVGILELGSYLWRRRMQTSNRHSEERNVGDEKMRIPLKVITECSRPAVTGYGYEVLNASPRNSESDSALESDEDDYRII